MITDKYNTVINHNQNFDYISAILISSGHIVFAWTDQDGTQLDILLSYLPIQFGSLQRGMKSKTDLFVAVSNFGMFGFQINGTEKHPGYVGEKLNLGGHNRTTSELAGLINGVIEQLAILSD